ncbi:hypothetical protein QE193_24500 (plasmid) [Arsenophonus nasoniae]|nr:hypothetical protein [Arsenophonus nasoniae]WGM18367.1 hypothetical protein QE193_24500 [Arsenophonus nasoniae]
MSEEKLSSDIGECQCRMIDTLISALNELSWQLGGGREIHHGDRKS